MQRVLIFVVAYNAESTLRQVIHRIPHQIFDRYETEILVIDDASIDDTFAICNELIDPYSNVSLTVLKNPLNQGYGGNQKLGYQYAIREGFDYVILLHGDGQYAPEEMPRLLDHLVENDCHAVFGSRMLQPREALKGGMPRYKYVGNRILTWIQNRLTGLKLSEWHSGYRLYSVEALRKLPFDRNSNDFDFDTQIILQLQLARCRIDELAVPTFYGDEICHVNGIKYAFQVVHATYLSCLSKLGIFHDSKYETSTGESPYVAKFGYESSHQLALDAVRDGERLLILGCGPEETVAPFANRAESLFLVDLNISEKLREISDEVLQADLNQLSEEQLGETSFDCVFILDVIEHLDNPEEFLARLRRFKQLKDARFILTTPNVVFLPVRMMFALGQFNYGTRGILDKTHTRLFTYGSFRRLMIQQEYEVIQRRGIPAPFPLAIGHGWLSSVLLRLNGWGIFLFPRMFAYQIFCEAKPKPSVEQLLSETENHSEQLRELVSA